jgi:hypothetical protein
MDRPAPGHLERARHDVGEETEASLRAMSRAP